MRLLRILFFVTLVAVVPACSNEPTPAMVGSEALDKLPPGPEIKVSPQAKNIRAEGPSGGASGGTNLAPSK